MVLVQLSKSVTRITSTHKYQLCTLDQYSISDTSDLTYKSDSNDTIDMTGHVYHKDHRVISQLSAV